MNIASKRKAINKTECNRGKYDKPYSDISLQVNNLTESIKTGQVRVGLATHRVPFYEAE